MRLESNEYQTDSDKGRWRLQICKDCQIELLKSEVFR